MKKNLLLVLLTVSLSITILVGCENKPTNELNSDNQTNAEISGDAENVLVTDDIFSDEVSDEIYLTLDAHGLAGGILSLTEASDEGSTTVNETVAIDFAGTENEKIKDILVRNGILNVKPELEGDSFEGWVGFKQVITTDVEGYNTYSYEKIYEDDKILTTDELLEMPLPNQNITFMAKWATIPMSDYVIEGWSDAPVMDTCLFIFNANGGTMIFKDEEHESYELDKYTYWLNEGESLNDVMDGSLINSAIMLSVEKEEATFDGWKVYEADSINWSNQEDNEDGYLYFPYDENDEDFKYIILENATLYSESATLEELSKIVYEGKNYYAIANWK